jgi:hypothetical protein
MQLSDLRSKATILASFPIRKAEVYVHEGRRVADENDGDIKDRYYVDTNRNGTLDFQGSNYQTGFWNPELKRHPQLSSYEPVLVISPQQIKDYMTLNEKGPVVTVDDLGDLQTQQVFKLVEPENRTKEGRDGRTWAARGWGNLSQEQALVIDNPLPNHSPKESVKWALEFNKADCPETDGAEGNLYLFAPKS